MTAPTVKFTPNPAKPGDVVLATITSDPGARDIVTEETVHATFKAGALTAEGDMTIKRVTGYTAWVAAGWELVSDDGSTAVLRSTVR